MTQDEIDRLDEAYSKTVQFNRYHAMQGALLQIISHGKQTLAHGAGDAGCWSALAMCVNLAQEALERH